MRSINYFCRNLLLVDQYAINHNIKSLKFMHKLSSKDFRQVEEKNALRKQKG